MSDSVAFDRVAARISSLELRVDDVEEARRLDAEALARLEVHVTNFNAADVLNREYAGQIERLAARIAALEARS